MIKGSIILVVIPACNEEGSIAKVILKAQKYVDNIAVCDDCSRELTCKAAEALGIIVVKHRRNPGKGAAFRTLSAKAEETCAGIPVGSRFMKENDNSSCVPSYRTLGNWVLSMITDRHLRDT